MNPHLPHPVRAQGVISRAIGDGFVVIEPVTQTAHSLEGLPAAVWRALDEGALPIAPTQELDQVFAELADLGLVKESAGSFSRRSVLKKSGLVVAGAGIVTIALPPSIAAASPMFNFADGKTTAGPIFIEVPANPGGSPRTLHVTIAGASGGAGQVTAGRTAGSGGGGTTFSFDLTQPAGGAAFSLLGFVGGGGKSGGAGGAGGAGGTGRDATTGGNGGTSTKSGGGGGAGTFLTDSAGELVAVAGGGGGGGAASTGGNGGGGGGAGAVVSAALFDNTAESGADGTDNTVRDRAGNGGIGGRSRRDAANPLGLRTPGSGGDGPAPGPADNGSSGTGGVGGAGATYAGPNAGSGGGGGGGYAGGGGGGAGSAGGATNNGGGGGGGGGSDFLARPIDAFAGGAFTVATTGAPPVTVGTDVASGNGPDGSIAITSP